ncbi:MAG: GreA/GreB family elongation factor [Myxococcota bacterium]
MPGRSPTNAPMDKKPLFAALLTQLNEELAIVKSAAAAAREGATHEEAKPENQYDTRALEQSYLAGAQTARAESLSQAVASVELFEPPALGPDDPIRVGAAVVVDDGQEVRRYLLCDFGGGTKMKVGEQRWWVITPGSPLGRALVGRRVGDVIERRVRKEEISLEVIEVY